MSRELPETPISKYVSERLVSHISTRDVRNLSIRACVTVHGVARNSCFEVVSEVDVLDVLSQVGANEVWCVALPQELLVKTHNPTRGTSNHLERSPVKKERAVDHTTYILHLFGVQECSNSLVTCSSRALS